MFVFCLNWYVYDSLYYNLMKVWLKLVSIFSCEQLKGSHFFTSFRYRIRTHGKKLTSFVLLKDYAINKYLTHIQFQITHICFH